MQYVYAAVGILMLVLLLSTLPKSYRAREFDFTSLAVAAAVIFPNITTSVAVFTSGRVVSADVNFNRVVTYKGLSLQVNAIASPILTVLLLVLVVATVRRVSDFRWAGLLYTALILAAALAAASSPPGAQLALLALAVAATVLKGGQSAAFGAGAAVALLGALSFIAGAVFPEQAFIPCDDRKCGIAGSLYSGIADNHNSFGLLMALGVPFVYLGLRSWGRTLAALTVLLVLMSGDRTAQAAAIVSYLALAIFSKKDGSFRIMRVAQVAAGAGVLLIVALPFAQLADSALTGRPYYWRLAIARFANEPIIGHGTDSWRNLVRTGVIPLQAGYSTHNQFVEALFVTGLVGAVLICALVVSIAKQSPDRTKLALAALPIVICSITERAWSLDRIDWMSWSFLALVLYAMPLRQRVPDHTAKRRDDTYRPSNLITKK